MFILIVKILFNHLILKIMKILFLFIALSIILASCKDTDEVIDISYPKTNLVGSVWQSPAFVGALTKVQYYYFIDFKSRTSVQMYTAEKDGSNVLGEKKTHPLTIQESNRNMDSFQIYYPDTQKSVAGFTSKDINQIRFSTDTYTRFK